MNIDLPLRELGAIDTTALRDAIFSQEDAAWHEDESRQKSYYMHDQTRSLILLATDDTKWPERHVSKGPGWDRIADVDGRIQGSVEPVTRSLATSCRFVLPAATDSDGRNSCGYLAL